MPFTPGSPYKESGPREALDQKVAGREHLDDKDYVEALVVVVGFLALGGVGAATTQYLYEPYNPGFLKYPTIVALHVVLGGLYLMVAFVLHSSLAEVWIRLTLRSSGPGSSTKILYKPAPDTR
jgi:hypothetical protein